jgi:hypothetical protein
MTPGWSIALEQSHTSTLYNPGLDDFLRIPEFNCKDLIKLNGVLICFRKNTVKNSVIVRKHYRETLGSAEVQGAIAPPTR